MRRRGLASALLLLTGSVAACKATTFSIDLPHASSGDPWLIAVQPLAGALRVDWRPLTDEEEYEITVNGGTDAIVVTCTSSTLCSATLRAAESSVSTSWEVRISVPGNESPVVGADAIPGGWDGRLPTPLTPWQGPDDADDSYGAVMGAAGDVNGDGLGDYVITGSYYDARGATNDRGIAHLFFGTAGGPPASPSWTAIGPGDLDYLGLAFARVGDRNSDGLDDFALGMPLNNAGEAAAAQLMLYGSVPGATPSPMTPIDGGQVNAQFGHALAAGEFDGIAGRDILVSEWFWDSGTTDRGRVLGLLNGSTTISSWVDGPAVANARFGAQLVALGNVTGDGVEEWGVKIDNGATKGLEIRSGVGPAVYSLSKGSRIEPAGDVDGNGFDDVLFGVIGTSVQLVLGGGTLTPSTQILSGAHGSGPQFAATFCGGGDLNGDGWDDVVVMDREFDNAFTDAGRALVFYGSEQGIDVATTFEVEGLSTGERLSRCAFAGDVNGDGSDELLLAGLNGLVRILGGAPGRGPRIAMETVSVTREGGNVHVISGLDYEGLAPLTCELDWGDGSIDSGLCDDDPWTHEFEQSGNFTATLMVTDSRGDVAHALVQLRR